MQQVNDISSLALEALRTRTSNVLPAQIRSCVEQLSEERYGGDRTRKVIRWEISYFMCAGRFSTSYVEVSAVLNMNVTARRSSLQQAQSQSSNCSQCLMKW